MKVVEAISDTNIGGAGILLLNRLKYSDRKKIRTIVLIPQGSKLKSRLSEIGIATVEMRGCQDQSLDWRAVWEIRRILQRIRPDIVNCHGCLSARIAAKSCGFPITVYTRHCAYPLTAWQSTPVARFLIGKAQQMLSDQMIAVAEAAKDNLTDMGVSSDRIRVIVNGVEGFLRRSLSERNQVRQSLRIPQNATVVGICARLEPCKGHYDFLRAAKLLLQRSKRYRFLIIGSGSLSQRLKAYCDIEGLAPYVRFTGFAEDVSPYYNVMDINVNCSVGTETSSLALSEGMSLGIPAVVSDYGGNPYMVRNGENGLVYPTGRYDLLANQIHRITCDRNLYQRLSYGAYQRFLTELNAKRMTEETERLYRSLYKKTQAKYRKEERTVSLKLRQYGL